MRTSVFRRSSPLAFVAAVALAGCSGAMTPASRAAPEMGASAGAGADTGYLEVLSSKRNTIRCRHTAEGQSITFHAHGGAFGPYPGNFTAHGTYSDDASTGSWSFSESFTIVSNSKTLSGTVQGESGSALERHRPHPLICSDRFATSLTYATNSRSGNATATIQTPHLFSESLYNL
jgi:hypothetical protein